VPNRVKKTFRIVCSGSFPCRPTIQQTQFNGFLITQYYTGKVIGQMQSFYAGMVLSLIRIVQPEDVGICRSFLFRILFVARSDDVTGAPT
jgi:hypothetical protein